MLLLAGIQGPEQRPGLRPGAQRPRSAGKRAEQVCSRQNMSARYEVARTACTTSCEVPPTVPPTGFEPALTAPERVVLSGSDQRRRARRHPPRAHIGRGPLDCDGPPRQSPMMFRRWRYNINTLSNTVDLRAPGAGSVRELRECVLGGRW